MQRAAATPLLFATLLCAFALNATPMPGQTAAPTGAQTGTQTTIQSGLPATSSAAGIAPTHTLVPIPMPVITPGQMELLHLEGEFSEAVTKGGGKAFAAHFADDGVTLSNGKPPVQGLRAITAASKWDPKTYQLSWYAEGAQMAPSNDSGFTWGHYDATTIAADGTPSTASGRYFTFWKKVNGKWKVALDASADEPPAPPSAPGASLPAAIPPQ